MFACAGTPISAAILAMSGHSLMQLGCQRIETSHQRYSTGVMLSVFHAAQKLAPPRPENLQHAEATRFVYASDYPDQHHHLFNEYHTCLLQKDGLKPTITGADPVHTIQEIAPSRVSVFIIEMARNIRGLSLQHNAKGTVKECGFRLSYRQKRYSQARASKLRPSWTITRY